MVKRNSKGTINWPGMVETSQPDVPANATRVHNPLGHISQAPAGTIYVTDQGVAGGDGCQYNWPPHADGQKWNDNPILQPPNGYENGPMIGLVATGIVSKKRK